MFRRGRTVPPPGMATTISVPGFDNAPLSTTIPQPVLEQCGAAGLSVPPTQRSADAPLKASAEVPARIDLPMESELHFDDDDRDDRDNNDCQTVWGVSSEKDKENLKEAQNKYAKLSVDEAHRLVFRQPADLPAGTASLDPFAVAQQVDPFNPFARRRGVASNLAVGGQCELSNRRLTVPGTRALHPDIIPNSRHKDEYKIVPLDGDPFGAAVATVGDFKAFADIETGC